MAELFTPMFANRICKDLTEDEGRELARTINEEKESLKFEIEKDLFGVGKGISIKSLKEDIQIDRKNLQCVRSVMSYKEYTYIPTQAEWNDMLFNAQIPYIEKMEFYGSYCFGGFFHYTLEKENDSYILKDHKEKTERKLILHDFAAKLADVHLGEWRNGYSCSDYGWLVCDGSSWNLCITYENKFKATVVSGINAYPYNFQEFLDAFDMSYLDDKKFE